VNGWWYGVVGETVVVFGLVEGGPKLRAVYHSGGDFEAAFGAPRAALESEWRAMLAALVVPPAQVAASAERFRGTSVFQRPCPHAIAKRREQAGDAYEAGDRPRAIALMRRVCRDAPEEPRNWLELGNFLVGPDPADLAEAERLWTKLATDAEGVTSSLRAQAYERLARQAGSRGDLAAAAKLVAAGRALPIEQTDRRTLDGMAFALEHAGPAGPALRAYFFPRGFGVPPVQHALVASVAEPELGFAHYLLGLQYAGAGNWAGAARALDRALARALPAIAFVKNAARRLAVAAYRTHDYNRLSVAITVLSGSAMASGDRLLARDWLDRLGFDALTSR
jgi:tetratricopeptide (TPR) repeat protein